MKHSISSVFHLTQTSVITCPVTGIAMQINIPNMGIDYEVYSPFVKFSNVQKVLEQPTPKIKELPSSILSGMLLAVLNQYGMAEQHEIEAWEANIYIQNCSKHEIISAIRFLSNISSSQRDALPSLSLHSFKDSIEHSTSSNIINTYIKTCRDIVNPPADENVSILSSETSINKTEKKVGKKQLSSSERGRIKELIAEVALDELMTSKVLNILKIVAQKDNIYTISQELKEKLVTRLEELQSEASLELAAIIKKATPSIMQQEDLDISRVSDTFAIVKARKSLSEILAAKKNKTCEAPTPETIIISSTEDNSEEF